jgi:hypothetical protein
LYVGALQACNDLHGLFRLQHISPSAHNVWHGDFALSNRCCSSPQRAFPCVWFVFCRQHFESHGFFGLQRSQVTFFQQGFLPCLTPDGKVIMESTSKVG